MVRNYKPVAVKALPWARVLKPIIEAKEKGLAVRDLAAALDVEADDPALEKAIDTLLNSRRVRRFFGRDLAGRPSDVLQVYAERVSKRDVLFGVEPVEVVSDESV